MAVPFPVRLLRRSPLLAAIAATVSTGALAQQADVPAEQPQVVREYTPLSAERLDQMVPKHPGYLGALAPQNLAKPRPKAPIDLTGTWFIDLHEGFLQVPVRPALIPSSTKRAAEALVEARSGADARARPIATRSASAIRRACR